MDTKVIIIGAGLSGLVLAQGLATRNIDFKIFEKRSDSIRKEGHRFRVSTTVVNDLKAILPENVRREFEETINEPNKLKPRYVNARNLEFSEPIVENDPATMPIDRTWIVSLLRKGLDEHIVYGSDYVSYSVANDRVEAHFADGSIVKGSFLVGADGVYSLVRRQLQPNRRLVDLQKTMVWGRMPLTQDLREAVHNEDIFSWSMMQDDRNNTQCVLEPIEWKKESHSPAHFEDYQYFALCGDAEARSDDNVSQCKEIIAEITHPWHQTLKMLLSKTDLSRSRYARILSSKPNLELEDISSEDKARVLIIGDAAHPMSPAGGSGATTAIQCTLELIPILSSDKIDSQKIEQFHGMMQKVASTKIEHSFAGGQKYWQGKEWQQYPDAHV